MSSPLALVFIIVLVAAAFGDLEYYQGKGERKMSQMVERVRGRRFSVGSLRVVVFDVANICENSGSEKRCASENFSVFASVFRSGVVLWALFWWFSYRMCCFCVEFRIQSGAMDGCFDQFWG